MLRKTTEGLDNLFLPRIKQNKKKTRSKAEIMNKDCLIIYLKENNLSYNIFI